MSEECVYLLTRIQQLEHKLALTLELVAELEKYDIRQFIPEGNACVSSQHGCCDLINTKLCPYCKSSKVYDGIYFIKHPNCPKKGEG